MAEKRRSPSKKTRFEVFKRDAFTCQYCGAKAPDVVLHLDHIKPVSRGGSNRLTNLVTACQSCNGGKGARELSDDSVAAKARLQAEEQQERIEQTKMMLRWQDSLVEARELVVTHMDERWRTLAPGWVASVPGRRSMRGWLNKHSVDDLYRAMEIAADQYLKWDGDAVTRESWEVAFDKIPRIANSLKRERDDPEEAQVLRFTSYVCGGGLGSGWDYRQCAAAIRKARESGATWDEINRAVSVSNTPASFRRLLEE